MGKCLRDPDRCVRLLAEIAFGDLSRRQFGVPAARELASIRRHLDGRRYEKAIALLQQLTSARTDFAEAWYQLAIATFASGDFRSAVQFAQRALEINKYHFAAHALVARCWVELDEPTRALRSFEASYFVNPSQIVVKGYIDKIKRAARRFNTDNPL